MKDFKGDVFFFYLGCRLAFLRKKTKCLVFSAPMDKISKQADSEAQTKTFGSYTLNRNVLF